MLALLTIASLPSCSDGDETLSVDEFCDRIAEVQVLDAQLGQIETGALEESYQELRELSEQAPLEIRGSVDALADYVGQVVEAMEEVEAGDVEGADEALRGLDPTTVTEAQAAGQELERYTAEQCGLDLRTGSSVPATSAPPSSGAPTTGTPTTRPPTTAG